MKKFANKKEVVAFVIFACKRQFGFAPHAKDIIISHYGREFVVFKVCGKEYIVKMYHDIPIVNCTNFYSPAF